MGRRSPVGQWARTARSRAGRPVSEVLAGQGTVGVACGRYGRVVLRVRLIGALRVDGDGAPVAWPAGRRAGELLAYLALYPGAHPRLVLAERFWPDVLERSARASLRTALHELRVDLGGAASAVRAEREVV